MHVAIDALPINNFSGRNVLSGHLRNLARASAGRHRFSVFHHAGNRDLRRDLGAHVEWIECTGLGASWPQRLLWQATRMNRRLQEIGADLLLSTSGAMVPGVNIPQAVLVQNPWCFFPQFHQTFRDRVKARLQRAGYRRAQRGAAGMFYLSDYMARIYADNADAAPRYGATVLVGVDDRYFVSAQAQPPAAFDDRVMEIVTLSVMTPHKAIEDVLDAFALLRRRGIGARLLLVGPWASAQYRSDIERRIESAGLGGAVEITGQVSDADLEHHYRRARVFCLLSRCESFGIPAVEAQVFGTPSVVAGVCAPPEIAGPGGKIVAPGDIEAAAGVLEELLTDPQKWRVASASARANAERFRWERLTSPVIDFLDQTPPGSARLRTG